VAEKTGQEKQLFTRYKGNPRNKFQKVLRERPSRKKEGRKDELSYRLEQL
jgi:hypothetical protein